MWLVHSPTEVLTKHFGTSHSIQSSHLTGPRVSMWLASSPILDKSRSTGPALTTDLISVRAALRVCLRLMGAAPHVFRTRPPDRRRASAARSLAHPAQIRPDLAARLHPGLLVCPQCHFSEPLGSGREDPRDPRHRSGPGRGRTAGGGRCEVPRRRAFAGGRGCAGASAPREPGSGGRFRPRLPRGRAHPSGPSVPFAGPAAPK